MGRGPCAEVSVKWVRWCWLEGFLGSGPGGVDGRECEGLKGLDGGPWLW